MKIKKIINICKKSDVMYLFNLEDEGLQYISNGDALYPLYNLPYFDFESICNTFDIPVNTRNKIVFRYMENLPSYISTNDTYAPEISCEIYSDMSIGDYLPIKTELGLKFIHKQYLAPFENMECIELYLRVNEKDNFKYFVVKQGLILYGIIMSDDTVITENFVNDLGEIYAQAKDILSQRQNEAKKNE